jgi:hypothetical protein
MVKWLSSNAKLFSYELNGWTFSTPYYLADGIYPDWTCFMTTISNPVGNKNKLHAKIQESNQKERAFRDCKSTLNMIVKKERSLPDYEELID